MKDILGKHSWVSHMNHNLASGDAPQSDVPRADNPFRKGSITFRDTAPMVLVHGLCLLVFWVGYSWFALTVCLVLYAVRVFALTAGYHRLFSHNAFRTSRWFQFLLAFAGATAAQLGPLWWAAHHRRHHRFVDTANDVHSPRYGGFFWAHMGWLLRKSARETNPEVIRDLYKYPELRWLDRYVLLAPLSLIAILFAIGYWLGRSYPQLHTSGPQLVVWGFFISTVLVYHVTFMVNSVNHTFGTRRFQTGDDSRNNILVAFLTFGEGWHNNHHRFSASARQGFYWWELDITWYILKALAAVGLVWDLKSPPPRVYEEAAEG
jgi:stearoyl-CoA desaturase (delta-9 desaturase)